MRLDVYLVQQGYFPSREKAKLAITEGLVWVNQQPASKAGLDVKDHDHVEVREPEALLRYVSLGGFKLEKAIQDFALDLTGKRVLDVGASTGGFTDCALQHGAAHVFAVDVGQMQLHPTLRQHPQVTWQENTNIRDYSLPQPVDLIVMDVSFVSQAQLYPSIRPLLREDGWFISLIKPQFELEQRMRFPRGIVLDPSLHVRILERLVSNARDQHLFLHQLSFAPLRQNKNIEYLGLFGTAAPAAWPPVRQLVEDVFSRLDRL